VVELLKTEQQVDGKYWKPPLAENIDSFLKGNCPYIPMDDLLEIIYTSQYRSVLKQGQLIQQYNSSK
jgi:hypothetical protein